MLCTKLKKGLCCGTSNVDCGIYLGLPTYFYVPTVRLHSSHTPEWESLYHNFDPTDLLSSWFHGVVQCSKDSMELNTKQIGWVKVEI